MSIVHYNSPLFEIGENNEEIPEWRDPATSFDYQRLERKKKNRTSHVEYVGPRRQNFHSELDINVMLDNQEDLRCQVERDVPHPPGDARSTASEIIKRRSRPWPGGIPTHRKYAVSLQNRERTRMRSARAKLLEKGGKSPP